MLNAVLDAQASVEGTEWGSGSADCDVRAGQMAGPRRYCATLTPSPTMLRVSPQNCGSGSRSRENGRRKLGRTQCHFFEPLNGLPKKRKLPPPFSRLPLPDRTGLRSFTDLDEPAAPLQQEWGFSHRDWQQACWIGDGELLVRRGGEMRDCRGRQ